MTRRTEPRRPVLVSAQGLRRIVLGAVAGELDRHGDAHATPPRAGAVPTAPPRLSGPVAGCLLVVTQLDAGGLDTHAQEVMAAAALLARGDEAVVLLVPTAEPPGEGTVLPGVDLAAWGVDRLEILPLAQAPGNAPMQALLDALAWRWQGLRPRLLLMPDRGADADLGRRLAVALGLSVAAGVVEVNAGRVRVPDRGGLGRPAGDATAALDELQLLLLARQAASTELPFAGLGERRVLDGPPVPQPGPSSVAGPRDLGPLPGQALQASLDEADFILAAGNGVTDVGLFNELAVALGAAVGASRVAVDDGRFARSQQIGATGRTVQARGYLALGISGAVQHLQGIRECRHVMAVNTDPAAPIVQRAELTVAEDAQALMLALLDLLRPPPGSMESPP